MKREKREEPSIQDVLDAVSTFATKVEGDLGELKKDVGGLKQDVSELRRDVSELRRDVGELKQDVSGLKYDVRSLKQDVGSLKQDDIALRHDVAYLKNNMVTKDYLDASQFKMKGEMGMWLRKEDDKVNELTGLLADKAVISRIDSKKIAAMGPFAKKS